MNTQTTNLTVQKVLELAQHLSLVDQCALIERLNRQIEASLPEHATVNEAIALYLADKCSLGRAAELAHITRWEMIDILKKRHVPVIVDTDFTAAEMDAVAEELEREGIMC